MMPNDFTNAKGKKREQDKCDEIDLSECSFYAACVAA
jgi:hypothetical protein